jgi:hypothetical protein
MEPGQLWQFNALVSNIHIGEDWIYENKNSITRDIFIQWSCFSINNKYRYG